MSSLADGNLDENANPDVNFADSCRLSTDLGHRLDIVAYHI